MFFQKFHRGTYHVQILLQLGVNNLCNVNIPRFSEYGFYRSLAFNQMLQNLVLLRQYFWLPRAAERGNF
jgi:hypothetical protein